MHKIFCISGLGTDEEIFKNLKIEGYQLVFIKWITPFPKESISKYAARILLQITETKPIIIGVSFGGLLAIEISKLISVKKIFLVSAFKNSKEKIWWLKALKYLPLHKIFIPGSHNFLEPIRNYNLGAETATEKEMAKKFRSTVDPFYLKWAINCIINWKNSTTSDNIIHIHGTADKLFPIRNLIVDHRIKGGTHMMIYNRSNEISLIMNIILAN